MSRIALTPDDCPWCPEHPVLEPPPQSNVTCDVCGQPITEMELCQLLDLVRYEPCRCVVDGARRYAEVLS